MCYAGSSSEPDLSAITTLLVLPFDNFGIKATVPLETRQTFLSAWHSLFDAVGCFWRCRGLGWGGVPEEREKHVTHRREVSRVSCLVTTPHNKDEIVAATTITRFSFVLSPRPSTLHVLFHLCLSSYFF